MRFDGVKPNFVEGDGQALLVFCDILKVNEGGSDCSLAKACRTLRKQELEHSVKFAEPDASESCEFCWHSRLAIEPQPSQWGLDRALRDWLAHRLAAQADEIVEPPRSHLRN